MEQYFPTINEGKKYEIRSTMGSKIKMTKSMSVIRNHRSILSDGILMVKQSIFTIIDYYIVHCYPCITFMNTHKKILK